ncbi:hypothetical protein [Enterococcus camelliae]|uniref:Uncharacterized protein n=1 Tax=Enterococcus camelliae TaxID=453959 RepID=A0ABW5TLI5_9ENTE
MDEQFAALHLTVVELPVEWVDEAPVFRGFFREIPTMTGEGRTKQQMYRQLLENYQLFFEKQQAQALEETPTAMTSALLSVEDLLKYYDGESFDGFSYDFSAKESGDHD